MPPVSSGSERRSPRFQRVGKVIEPILTPERLVAVEIERRPEHLPSDRLAGQSRLGLAERRLVGSGEQAFPVEPGRIGEPDDRAGIGDVAFVRPDGAEAGMDEVGDRAALVEGGQQDPVGEGRVGRVEFRVQHQRDAADAAPALHLDEAVGLPLQGPLLDGLAATGGEDSSAGVTVMMVASAETITNGMSPVPLGDCSDPLASSAMTPSGGVITPLTAATSGTSILERALSEIFPSGEEEERGVTVRSSADSVGVTAAVPAAFVGHGGGDTAAAAVEILHRSQAQWSEGENNSSLTDPCGFHTTHPIRLRFSKLKSGSQH